MPIAWFPRRVRRRRPSYLRYGGWTDRRLRCSQRPGIAAEVLPSWRPLSQAYRSPAANSVSTTTIRPRYHRVKHRRPFAGTTKYCSLESFVLNSSNYKHYVVSSISYWHSDSNNNISCAGGRHNMPPPLQVDLWPVDLESSVRVRCDVGYLCANFSLPRPLCSRHRPDVRDRQASDVIRDVVLEASASARGGLEAVFLAGSASPRPHTVLPRSRPFCLGPAALPHSFCLGLGSVWKVAPCLGSVVISQLKRASAHGAQVQG